MKVGKYYSNLSHFEIRDMKQEIKDYGFQNKIEQNSVHKSKHLATHSGRSEQPMKSDYKCRKY
jgi:hypothetical protein